MSLSMLGMIDPTFGTDTVTIQSVEGAFVDGVWVDDAPPTETTHRATKQIQNSDEFPQLSDGGERITEVAAFYINDGSVHQVGSILRDENGNKYRIFNADCRPLRHYCKLIGVHRAHD